jgi:CheY-like chemotaxis protein
MDIQMPIMDCFRTTALIRERERETCAHTPIIIGGGTDALQPRFERIRRSEPGDE